LLYLTGSKFAIVLVYVDDIILTTNDDEKLQEIKMKFSQEFETTDLGEVQKFLGMEIYRDRSRKLMVLHQKSLIESILKKFYIDENCRTVSTPMLSTDAE